MDALQFVIRLHVDIFSSAPFAVLLLENAKSTCQSLCNQITVLSPFFYSMCHLDFGFFRNWLGMWGSIRHAGFVI